MTDKKDAPHTISEQNAALDIAVIGMGCLFPKAESIDEFWRNIRDGVDCITEIPATHWRPDDYFSENKKSPDMTYARRGGFLSPFPFNPMEYGIAPHAIEATDTSQLLAMVVAQMALTDAGYGPDATFNRERVSCIMGVTGTLELVIPLGARLGHPIWRRALKDAGVDDTVANDVVERISESYVGWQENSFPGLLGNVVAGRIANRLNLGGTNCVVDAACASSLSALHLAVLELSAGRSDMVVTGGVDTFNDIFMYMCFSKTPALSPTGDARPFSVDADGTILGEGIGSVILKRRVDAERDGDQIYAVIKAMGTSSDGRGQAIYAPSADGQAKALRNAYSQAGFRPSTVELVEGHGTGTKIGDAVELSALTKVYAENGSKDDIWCAVGSVKSQIGHTKAAAGAAGLIKAVMALHHKVLPPTLKITAAAEVLKDSPFYANTKPRPWVRTKDHPRRAAVSAFGFGGSNFHCLLEEPTGPGARRRRALGDDVQIIPYGAADVRSLVAELKGDAQIKIDHWDSVRTLAARRRQGFDPASPVRLSLVIDSDRMTEFAATLQQAAGTLTQKPELSSWQTPDGIFFDRRPASAKIAGLFPGQGAQYPGMLLDLALASDHLIDSLDLAEDLAKVRHRKLARLIYPQGEETPDAANRLTATENAQPAIGAVSAGSWKLLRSFDLHLDMAAGHSFGELSALYAAGVLEEDTLHSLAAHRGALMAPTQGTCRGGMLAVAASREKVSALLKSEGLGLVLANDNAPEQVVVSGPLAAIAQAEDVFQKHQILTRPLQVSAAFHSPLVQDAEAPFRAFVAAQTFHKPDFPVFANTSAKPYPTGPQQAAATLGTQLTQPVRFVESVRAMYDAGARIFIEIGPGRKLSGLVRAILAGSPDVSIIALDQSTGRTSGTLDLAKALAELSARGVPLALKVWDQDFVAPKTAKNVMTVPISGANYVKPVAKRPPSAKVASPKPALQNTTITLQSNRNPSMSQPPKKSPTHVQPSDFVQESILALQRMQQQNADLHRQFLEGQAESQKLFFDLLSSQLGRPITVSAPAEIPRHETLPEHQPKPLVPAPAAAYVAPVQQPPMPTLKTPAPQPAPAAAPAPKAAPAPATRFTDALLAIVSDKTGYPQEMLSLDMSLEGDLGIDSIKRVEIFSELQERVSEAKGARTEELTVLQTLKEIVTFLEALAPSPKTAPSNVAATASAPSPAAPLAAAKSMAADVLLVISEKTGYPTEVLNLEMSLEGDLGIDSIKRVEIFSAMQERFPAAKDMNHEVMSNLKTLAEIVAHLDSSQAATTPAKPASTASAEVETSHQVAAPSVPPKPVQGVDRLVVDVEALEPAKEMLRPQAATDTFWLTRDDAGLAEATAKILQARGFSTTLIDLTAPKVQALPKRLAGLIVIAPQTPKDTRAFTLAAFGALKTCAPALRSAAVSGGSVFATVTRHGGLFGLTGITSEKTAFCGGISGLSKTASHEWPEVTCKALDVSSDQTAAEMAAALASEILGDGPTEVGISSGHRVTPKLRKEAVDLTRPLTSDLLSLGDLVVVTGGARGVTAEVSLQIAKTFQPTLLVLGRSPLPEADPAWSQGMTGESELKAALAAHAPNKLTPRELQDAYLHLIATRELRANLLRLEEAGAKVLYHSVDVRAEEDVAKIIQTASQAHGPVRGVVHGAGVLADRLIEDKNLAQFELVYDTKVGGFNGVMGAIDREALRFLVVFSSSTARFGRKGQVDYAVANEALNKATQYWHLQLPQCRILSVNWGPWDGGMVTPALKRLFQKEGVEVIGITSGAAYLVDELLHGDGAHREIVILGRAPRAGAEVSSKGFLGDSELFEVFSMDIEPESLPVLKAHILNGRAVVPAALTLEWLALAALQRNPGLHLEGLENFQVLKGITLAEGETMHLRFMAGVAKPAGPAFATKAEIRGTAANGEEMLFARAIVHLIEGTQAKAVSSLPRTRSVFGRNLGQAYAEDLFHGPLLRGITGIYGTSKTGISAQVSTTVKPHEFVKSPLRSAWITQPMAIDCAFQMMILWSVEHLNAACLPSKVGRYTQAQKEFPKDGCEVRIDITQQSPSRAVANIEFIDKGGQLVARIDGFEATVDAKLKSAFQRNSLNATVQP